MPWQRLVKLKKHLSQNLDSLYAHYDEQPVDKAMMLRTANQVVDFLTIDKHSGPSPTMILLLSKGYALTLAILLLKVIMISPKSRAYLEAKIGDLVNYYGEHPKEECKWLIQFLEILNVTFTIYSDRTVSYNLVAVSDKLKSKQLSNHSQSQKQTQDTQCSPEAIAVENYRIFSCRIDGSLPQTT